MVGRSLRRGFTLVELLVVIVIIGILVALLLPAINAAREAAVRNQCVSKLRQMGLAVNTFENTNKRFPMITTAKGNLLQVAPGSASGTPPAGYSWVVMVLPYMEENLLEQDISNASQKYKLPAFSPNIRRLDPNTGNAAGEHLAARTVPAVRCPKATGDFATATEYQSSIQVAPAVGNYVAFAGSFIDNGASPKAVNEDAAMNTPMTNGGKGLKIEDISDGTSKTLLITESREVAYGSWYDGQTAWVVGLLPPVTKASDIITRTDIDGYAGPIDGKVHALNYGPKDELDQTQLYLKRSDGNWAGQADRRWGPSSAHPGGVVVHVYADNHTSVISDKIEPYLYYRLITRNGNEPSSEEKPE